MSKHKITGLSVLALASLRVQIQDVLHCLDFIAGESLNTHKLKEQLRNRSLGLDYGFIEFAASERVLLKPDVSDLYSTDHLYRRMEHYLRRQKELQVEPLHADVGLFQHSASFLEKRAHGELAKSSDEEDSSDDELAKKLAELKAKNDIDTSLDDGDNNPPPAEPVQNENAENNPPVSETTEPHPGVDPEAIEPPPPVVDPEPTEQPPIENTKVKAEIAYNSKPTFVNGAGNLFYGSGIPSAGMAVINDGVIELGLSARMFGSKTVIESEDGKYALSLAAAEDWAVLVSAGLLDTTESSTVTDLYDLTLSIDGYVYNLAKTDAGYELTAPEVEHSISDIAVNKQGTAVQTIIRQFQEAVESVEVPVVLTATHKASSFTFSVDIVAVVSKAAE